jgi:hypothetical protein
LLLRFRLICLCCIVWVSIPALAQDGASASIVVETEFERSLLASVSLEVICSSGQFGESPRQLRAPGRTELGLADFQDKKTSCQLRVDLPDGYSAEYSVRSESVSRANQDGCQFARVAHGATNYCRIEVTQDPVSLTVYMKWIGRSGDEEDVQLSLECESGEYSGFRYINEGSPGGWEISQVDPEGILCNVSEKVRDTFSPDIIDCQGLYILPGKGEECTLINTKIVKRIEMLNRYGKIVMILLVLAIGLVAVRRLS